LAAEKGHADVAAALNVLSSLGGGVVLPGVNVTGVPAAGGACGTYTVAFAPQASAQLDRLTALGMGHFPICMAKTQKSLSDNESLLGRPTGFTLTVREVEVAAGAGFVVPITGAMMRMPGLPEVPAAEGMHVAADGTLSGLF
jgi:formate--tetrahydrofolate ligase